MCVLIMKILIRMDDEKSQSNIPPSKNLYLPSHPDDLFSNEGFIETIDSAVPYTDEYGGLWKMTTAKFTFKKTQ